MTRAEKTLIRIDLFNRQPHEVDGDVVNLWDLVDDIDTACELLEGARIVAGGIAELTMPLDDEEDTTPRRDN